MCRGLTNHTKHSIRPQCIAMHTIWYGQTVFNLDSMSSNSCAQARQIASLLPVAVAQRAMIEVQLAVIESRILEHR